MGERVISLQIHREPTRAKTKIDQSRFVIRTNNAITNDPCAICGTCTDPSGVDLMINGNELVCVPCGRLHAPVLQSLLDLANAAHAYTGHELREAFGIENEQF
jgi:hypothetical protein